MMGRSARSVAAPSPGGMSLTDSASVKGKLLSLEEMIRNLAEEMNFHKKEMQILRAEKETLQSILNSKNQDSGKSIKHEISRVEEEMRLNFTRKKTENNKLQQEINLLKGEKTALQQQLLALQRRITELELQIGND